MAAGTKHILAMSNSSAFFVEPTQPPYLAQYLVELTCKNDPVIVHVGAANGDSSEKAGKFFALAKRASFEPRHLNLFALDDGDPQTFFADADAIYIDGGSTRNLKALLSEWSADEALRRAYESGVVISGASAGANIVFQWGMTDSIKTRIEPVRGLGLINGTVSVHSDARLDRGEALERHLQGKDAEYPAYALEEGTALHFLGGTLHRTISAKRNAGVTVDRDGKGMVSLPIEHIARHAVSDTL